MNIEDKVGIAELIERGGIFPDINGTTPQEVLSAFVRAIPSIPSVSGENLLKAVLEREALMSTSIGKGIALPHPRNPLITSDADQFVALAFLKNRVEWNTLDGIPVDTLLLIISASARQHLHVLSRLNFFCQQEDFYRLLKNRAPREELLRFIRETEKNWE